MSRAPLVDIHYLRPPDREQIFTQHLIWDEDHVKVTFATGMSCDPPVRIDGDIVLETGSEVVWFTFPGRWHDVGLFHGSDGTFRGTYANILTPVVFEDERTWRTTDLFLDVWRDPSGSVELLDEDELREAETRRWITREVAGRAREEAMTLMERAEAGLWPPSIVSEWTLERARERLRDPSGTAARR